MFSAFSLDLSLQDPKNPRSPQSAVFPSRIPPPKSPTDARAAIAKAGARFCLRLDFCCCSWRNEAVYLRRPSTNGYSNTLPYL